MFRVILFGCADHPFGFLAPGVHATEAKAEDYIHNELATDGSLFTMGQVYRAIAELAPVTEIKRRPLLFGKEEE